MNLGDSQGEGWPWWQGWILVGVIGLVAVALASCSVNVCARPPCGPYLIEWH